MLNNKNSFPKAENLSIPANYKAKHFLLDKVPYANRAEWLFLVARNRAEKVIHKVVIIGACGIGFWMLLNLGPRFGETPNVVAGKVATINILTSLMFVFVFFVLVVQRMRRPVPRGELF